MRFPCSKKHLQVSLLMCFFISSCNTEEFYEMISTVEGRDAYCSQAVDLKSCEERANYCQPSYEDAEDETLPPVFSACIANPIVDPVPPTPGDGSTPTVPGDGGTPTDPDDGSTPTTPGDGSTPTAPEEEAPSIEDTVTANCTNLDPKYLWIKSTSQKNKVVSRVVKVKVCHQTGNLSMHTILIACPALKPHVDHHEDYIGACKL